MQALLRPAMLVFLDVNGISVHCSDEEVIKIGLAEESIDESAVMTDLL